jgi:hypothetical protein
LRKKRNRIHKYNAVLSEEDRRDFERAYNLIYYIYGELSGLKLFPNYDTLSDAIEKTATSMLPEVKKREVKNNTYITESRNVRLQPKETE